MGLQTVDGPISGTRAHINSPVLLAPPVRAISKGLARMADHVVVGKIGRVTDRIWPGRLGSVLIPVRGGTEEFYARAAPGVAIPAGEKVRVVSYAPPRSVDVELVVAEPSAAPPFRIPPRG